MPTPSSTLTSALSSFNEEDSEFLKSLARSPRAATEMTSAFLRHAVVSAEVDSRATVSVARPSELDQNRVEAALRAAALLGTFDPLKFIPEAREQDLTKLLAECTVSSDGERSRWSLRAATRLRLIERMTTTPGELVSAFEGARRYLEQTEEQPDEVTQALFNIVGKAPRRRNDFAAMSKEALAASRAVISWLQPLEKKLGFDAINLLGEIERAELLEPFRFLTGFNPQSGTDQFVGRKDQLRQLRTFVDAIASEGVLESIQRSGRRLIAGDRRMLGFSGVGGVGKSTLLSKFILQHVDSDKGISLYFAYLDFDRSTISAAQPVSLLLEMLRQMGWQAPEVTHELEQLRARIREEMERTRGSAQGNQPISRAHPTKEQTRETSPAEPIVFNETELPDELIGPSLLNTYLYETGHILERSGRKDLPLLLVLDTFEEAQVLGDQAVRRVESFLDAVQERVPRVRVVIAGRDAVDGFFANADRFVLSEFKDSASRIAFLESRGLSPGVAKSVASSVGGRPLALHLAARLVKEHGLDSISFSWAERFGSLFSEKLIEGILYRRILEHIDNKDVRDLAHPGLVLRRLDAQVLRTVVAPVVVHQEMSAERAEAILSAFRLQRDLVRVEADGSVTHRPDVREQMLALMQLEKPEQARSLHAAAAEYYARKQNERDADVRQRCQIEEIYHRLSIGDSLERVIALWSSAARIGLARAVDELENVAGRGTLKVLLGRTPSSEEVNALPDSVKRAYAIRTLDAALRLADPEQALAVLAEYSEFLPAEVKQSAEPRALDLAGQWRKAKRLFTKSVGEFGEKLPTMGDVLAAAEFFEKVDGPEPLRDGLIELLADLRVMLDESVDDRKWAMPLGLVELRLRVRQGTINRRLSVEDVAAVTNPKELLRGSSLLGNDLHWIMTLSGLDPDGLRLIERMPITDTVRGQLTYLRQLLGERKSASTENEIAIAFCEQLSRRVSIGELPQRKALDSITRTVEGLVLRHVLRPYTPQWYVPLASLIRREFDGVVSSSDLYPESLGPLPFKTASAFHKTSALADFLGRLDQLGVLHTCLQVHLLRGNRATGDSAAEVLKAYRSWRGVFLPDVDEWFGSFEQIRALELTSVSQSRTKAQRKRK